MISSYIFYSSSILLAMIFAGLSQKLHRSRNGKRIPHPVLYLISMSILIFVMGWRKLTGVDDGNYLNNYIEMNSMSLLNFYQFKATEPFYVLLNKLVYIVFNDFQWVIILSAIITIYFFFKAISYEMNSISLALSVFVFSTTMYFYFFGIIRLSIAASLIAFGCRYIQENKKKKYIFVVIVASLFHYSAMFALILLVFNKYQNNLLKAIMIIPVAFLGIRYISPYFGSRYQAYFENAVSLSFGFIDLIPFLLLFCFYYKRLIKTNENNSLYFMMFILIIITEFFSPIIGIGRMRWYLTISMCLLLPAVVRASKSFLEKYVVSLVTIIYGVIYAYYAYFGDSFRGMFMLPYQNVFFEFLS